MVTPPEKKFGGLTFGSQKKKEENIERALPRNQAEKKEGIQIFAVLYA